MSKIKQLAEKYSEKWKPVKYSDFKYDGGALFELVGGKWIHCHDAHYTKSKAQAIEEYMK